VGQERKLLVLANPFGGKKQAPTVWREVVEPVFELVPSLKIQYQETTHEGHAGMLILCRIQYNIELNDTIADCRRDCERPGFDGI